MHVDNIRRKMKENEAFNAQHVKRSLTKAYVGPDTWKDFAHVQLTDKGIDLSGHGEQSLIQLTDDEAKCLRDQLIAWFGEEAPDLPEPIPDLPF